MPGVASACSPRKPALLNASDTSVTRASLWRPAAMLVTKASATLTAAAVKDEPEVARMVVPLDVELGPNEEQAEAGERQRKQDGSPPGQ